MSPNEKLERERRWRERLDRNVEWYRDGGAAKMTEEELVASALFSPASSDVAGIRAELQARLIATMRELQASNETTAATISTLTAWLVGFTIMLVVLTVVLVVLAAIGALG
jgi:uncharacterized membrane protein